MDVSQLVHVTNVKVPETDRNVWADKARNAECIEQINDHRGTYTLWHDTTPGVNDYWVIRLAHDGSEYVRRTMWRSVVYYTRDRAFNAWSAITLGDAY